LTTWVWNRGGEVTSADGKTIALASKPGADALIFLSDLFKKKQATLVSKAFQEPTDFARGKIAFTFDATSGLGAYDRAIKNASQPFAWGIAPSPRTTRGVRSRARHRQNRVAARTRRARVRGLDA